MIQHVSLPSCSPPPVRVLFMCKIHSPQPNTPRRLNSPKYRLQISKYHLNQMWVRWGMLPPGAVFSIWERVMPDRLPASEIQWSDRHKVDHPTLKGRNQEKGLWAPNKLKPNRANSIRFWPNALSSQPTGVVALPLIPGWWTNLWNWKGGFILWDQGGGSALGVTLPLSLRMTHVPLQRALSANDFLHFNPSLFPSVQVGSISAEMVQGFTRHTLLLSRACFSFFAIWISWESSKFSKSSSFMLNNSFFS